MGIRRLFFLFFSFIVFSAHAYEVDNHTQRYEKLKDSRDIANDEVNFALDSRLKEVNFAKKCDPKVLFQEMSKALGGYVIGSLEWSAQKSSKYAKHRGEDPNIYSQRTGIDKVNSAALTVFGMHASINLHGQYVGVDKLGHFFDQGATYYEDYLSEKSPAAGIKKAISKGWAHENGVWGISTSGIRSYADLSANFAGMQFWMSLSEGAKPYFQCQNNQWVKVREFDFADYVTAAWDEGINCSTYRTKGLTEAVEKQEDFLEKKHQSKKRRFTCPISPNACAELKKSYGKNAENFLSPKCLKNAKADKDETRSSAQFSARELGISNYDEMAVTLTPAKKEKIKKGKR